MKLILLVLMVICLNADSEIEKYKMFKSEIEANMNKVYPGESWIFSHLSIGKTKNKAHQRAIKEVKAQDLAHKRNSAYIRTDSGFTLDVSKEIETVEFYSLVKNGCIEKKGWFLCEFKVKPMNYDKYTYSIRNGKHIRTKKL